MISGQFRTLAMFHSSYIIFETQVHIRFWTKKDTIECFVYLDSMKRLSNIELFHWKRMTFQIRINIKKYFFSVLGIPLHCITFQFRYFCKGIKVGDCGAFLCKLNFLSKISCTFVHRAAIFSFLFRWEERLQMRLKCPSWAPHLKCKI